MIVCGSWSVPVERTCTKFWQDRSNGTWICRQATTAGPYFYGQHLWCSGVTCRHNQASRRDARCQTFNKHLNKICQASYFHIQALRHVLRLMSADIANSVTCVNVGARLDYCNSILYSISDNNILKLPIVQHTLTRIVTGTKKEGAYNASAIETSMVACFS